MQTLSTKKTGRLILPFNQAACFSLQVDLVKFFKQDDALALFRTSRTGHSSKY
jgi:hypothetical protein